MIIRVSVSGKIIGMPGRAPVNDGSGAISTLSGEADGMVAANMIALRRAVRASLPVHSEWLSLDRFFRAGDAVRKIHSATEGPVEGNRPMLQLLHAVRSASRAPVVRLAAVLFLAAGFIAGVPALPAQAASDSSCAASPSHADCDGVLPGGACTTGTYYVVDSAPLINEYGRSSYSYGYIQLWWSKNCQTNWARLVVSLSGSWTAQPYVATQTGSPGDEYKDYYNVGPGAYVSPMLYAPGVKACADGEAFNSTGTYQAYAGQFTPC
jgi:hypothetical protein